MSPSAWKIAGIAVGATAASVVLVLVLGAAALAFFSSKVRASPPVTMTAALAPDTCDDKTPLFITVRNASNRTIDSVDYAVAAYEPGRSEDVTQGIGVRTFYTITPPHSSKAECVRLPTFKPGSVGADMSSLRFTASSWNVRTHD